MLYCHIIVQFLFYVLFGLVLGIQSSGLNLECFRFMHKIRESPFPDFLFLRFNHTIPLRGLFYIPSGWKDSLSLNDSYSSLTGGLVMNQTRNIKARKKMGISPHFSDCQGLSFYFFCTERWFLWVWLSTSSPLELQSREGEMKKQEEKHPEDFTSILFGIIFALFCFWLYGQKDVIFSLFLLPVSLQLWNHDEMITLKSKPWGKKKERERENGTHTHIICFLSFDLLFPIFLLLFNTFQSSKWLLFLFYPGFPLKPMRQIGYSGLTPSWLSLEVLMPFKIQNFIYFSNLLYGFWYFRVLVLSWVNIFSSYFARKSFISPKVSKVLLYTYRKQAKKCFLMSISSIYVVTSLHC